MDTNQRSVDTIKGQLLLIFVLRGVVFREAKITNCYDALPLLLFGTSIYKFSGVASELT